MDASERLTDWAAELKLSRISPEVIEKGKLSILNWFGVGIGALFDPETRGYLEAGRMLGTGNSPIVGTRRRSSLLGATWVNGALAHHLDFDDTHVATIVHPSAPVVAAALSMAVAGHASGRDFLKAVLVGQEVAIRLGVAMDISHRGSVWHYTGAVGAAASALAAGITMGLDSDGLSLAFLQGLTTVSGLQAAFGTMTKPFQVGRSGAEGVAAAIAAKAGITSSTKILEAYGKVVAGGIDTDVLVRGLGDEWMLLDNSFKPYACGVVLHPTIEAARQLHERGVDPSTLSEIQVTVHPTVMQLTAQMNPKTGLAGKFSITHAVACGLIDGAGGPRQFTDERVNDGALVRLRALVKVTPDPSINRGAARISIVARDGKRQEAVVDYGPNDAAIPMTKERLRAKYDDLVEVALDKNESNALWRRVDSLQSCRDVGQVAELSRPAR